jgi:hypothetical protein
VKKGGDGITHKLVRYGYTGCGLIKARDRTLEVTNVDRKVTCGPCIARRDAFRKSAQFRARAAGVA